MFFDAKQAGSSGLFGGRRKAIKQLRQQLAEDPTNAALHVQLAELLADAGRDEEALEAFLLGSHLYNAEGRAEEALDAASLTCRLFPEIPDVWISAADAYVEQARVVEAVHCLLSGAQVQLERRAPDAALQLLQHAAAIAPFPLRETVERSRAVAEKSRWRKPLLTLALSAENAVASASRGLLAKG